MPLKTKTSFVAISILDLNLCNLKEKLASWQQRGIKWLHIDVMDMHVVPNFSFGLPIIRSIAKYFSFHISIHFMTKIPPAMSVANYFTPWIQAGAHSIIYMFEAFQSQSRIKEFISLRHVWPKIMFGFALEPESSVAIITPWTKSVDIVLMMSVSSGRGGQKFKKQTIAKIKQVATYRSQHHLSYLIGVDGGVGGQEIKLVKNAGAEMIVVGSFLTKAAEHEDQRWTLIKK